MSLKLSAEKRELLRTTAVSPVRGVITHATSAGVETGKTGPTAARIKLSDHAYWSWAGPDNIRPAGKAKPAAQPGSTFWAWAGQP